MSNKGTEKEQIEALQIGYMAMTKTSTACRWKVLFRLKIFGIPYLFRDSEHFWKVVQGPIGKKLLEAGVDKGLKGLCYYDAGAGFYAKKPITSHGRPEGSESACECRALWRWR